MNQVEYTPFAYELLRTRSVSFEVQRLDVDQSINGVSRIQQLISQSRLEIVSTARGRLATQTHQSFTDRTFLLPSVPSETISQHQLNTNPSALFLQFLGRLQRCVADDVRCLVEDNHLQMR